MNENKRIPNFTGPEKNFLFTLIREKYSAVIEDKKTNRTSIEDKNRAWHKIEKEFNANGPISCHRTAESLKRLYENRKKFLRRMLGEEKKNRLLTGGGPMVPPGYKDKTDEILISILNEKTLVGLENSYGSDRFSNSIRKKDYEQSEEQTFILEPTCTSSQAEERASDVQEKRKKIPRPNHDLFDLSDEEEESFQQVGMGNRKRSWLSDSSISDVEQENLSPLNKNLLPSVNDSLQSSCLDESAKTPHSWKRYKPTDLQSTINPALKPTIDTPRLQQRNFNSKTKPKPKVSRRRPKNSVRVLTSSDVSKKYNILLDKRLILVDKQIQQLDETLQFQKQEQTLKLKLLNLDIDSKEAALKQNNN